jgi:hypothetical protein
VIGRADDSNGSIGDLARDLLELHAEACDARVADPVKLAEWMIRFGFDDQDFLTVDPIRYARALDEASLSWYRDEVHRRDGSSFAGGYARRRLAILDGDVDAIVALVGGDLNAPHQFIRVAEALAEMGREDDVLAWAQRGITETTGWQVGKLYNLACSVYARRSRFDEVLALRRQQHIRTPSVSTYGSLRTAAEVQGEWPAERPAALAVLRNSDVGGLADVLLDDGEPDAAWQVTIDFPEWDPGHRRWLRLAEARQPTHPAEALTVYLRLVDEQLETTGRDSYAGAISILKLSRRAAGAAGTEPDFAAHVANLREQHRRRPSFITMLDKAGLR